MRKVCPKEFQERISRVGGLNRYGQPNYKLVWSRTETHRAGGVWSHDRYIGYRECYLANGSPYPPRQGYWMLLEWDAPETFGSEVQYNFLHRDETTGLQTLGPYPFRGRYKILLKLIYTSLDEGKLTIYPWPLNSAIIRMVMPVVVAAKKDSLKRRKEFVAAEKAQTERKLDSGIESLMADSKRKALLPSKIDDRVRLLEKQWSEWLERNPKVSPGIQMVSR